MQTIERTMTTIPAAPGWYVGTFGLGFEGDPDYLRLRPIIAWEIEREPQRHGEQAWHNVMPLTTSGNMNFMANPWCIKTPEGRYEYSDTCYGSDEEADLLAEMKRDYEAELKRRAQSPMKASA